MKIVDRYTGEITTVYRKRLITGGLQECHETLIIDSENVITLVCILYNNVIISLYLMRGTQ